MDWLQPSQKITLLFIVWYIMPYSINLRLMFEVMFAFPSQFTQRKQVACQGRSLKTFPHATFASSQPNILSCLFWTPNFRGGMNLITDHKYKIKKWELIKQSSEPPGNTTKSMHCILWQRTTTGEKIWLIIWAKLWNKKLFESKYCWFLQKNTRQKQEETYWNKICQEYSRCKSINRSKVLNCKMCCKRAQSKTIGWSGLLQNTTVRSSTDRQRTVLFIVRNKRVQADQVCATRLLKAFTKTWIRHVGVLQITQLVSRYVQVKGLCAHLHTKEM